MQGNFAGVVISRSLLSFIIPWVSVSITDLILVNFALGTTLSGCFAGGLFRSGGFAQGFLACRHLGKGCP